MQRRWPTEAVRLTDQAKRNFYRILARGVLLRYGSGFWLFHAKGLASFGQKISYGRVAFHVFPVLLDMVLNPKRSVEILWRRLKKPTTHDKREPTELSVH